MIQRDAGVGSPVNLFGEASKILKNVKPGDKHSSNTMTISEAIGRDGRFNQNLLELIEEKYAEALEYTGINFLDSLKQYSQQFNIHGNTLGLDPQIPGNDYNFFTRPKLYLTPDNIRAIPYAHFMSYTDIGVLAMELLVYPDDESFPLTRNAGKMNYSISGDIEAGTIYNPLSSDKNTSIPDGFKPKLTELKGYGAIGRESLGNAEYAVSSIFDPLKTNTCISVSGFKDLVMEKYQTESDFAGYQSQYASGIDGTYSIGECTAVFEDAYRTPLFTSLLIHFLYIVAYTFGTVSPRKLDIVKRIIDYTFSIYTFSTAEDNSTILRWGRTMGNFPLNVPMDTISTNREKSLDKYKTLTANYGYNAYRPMDPRTHQDFNHLCMMNLAKNIDSYKKAFKGNKGETAMDFDIKDFKDPKKLLELHKRSKGGDMPKHWSHCPIIMGNKLIFV